MLVGETGVIFWVTKNKDAGDDKYGLQGYFFEGDGDVSNVTDFNARTQY